MKGLPFTRKEVSYLRGLVEQEKIRLLEDLSSVKRRELHTENQKELLKKIVSKNYFDTDKHIKKLEEAIETINKIETVLYPQN